MNTELLSKEVARCASQCEPNPKTLKVVENWLLNCDPGLRHRINVHDIANSSDESIDNILEIALDGTASGLFDMHWLIHCPHCNMISKENDNFFEVTQNSRCEMCEVEFVADFLNGIEVAFSLNRAIEDIALKAWCQPPLVLDPKFNIGLMPGDGTQGEDEISNPGEYRYFCPITLAKGILQIEGNPTDEVQEFSVKIMPSLKYDVVSLTARPAKLKFKFTNGSDSMAGLYIIRNELPGEIRLEDMPRRLSGLEVMHHPEYRRHFGGGCYI